MSLKDKKHRKGQAPVRLLSEASLFKVQAVIQYGLGNKFSEHDKLFKKLNHTEKIENRVHLMQSCFKQCIILPLNIS